MLEPEVQEMCHWAAELSTPKKQSSRKGRPAGLPFVGMDRAEFRLLAEALRALHIDGYSEERDVKQLLSLEAVSLSSELLHLPLVVREQEDGDLCVITDTLEMIVEVEKRSRRRKCRTWTIVIAFKLRTSFKETLRQTRLQQQTKTDQAEAGPG
jgi:hypothetical protein